MTTAIIGAGPAGCYLGSKLKWDKPIIFDKKPRLGYPIQCTGIVTDSIFRNIDGLPDDIIVNHIDTFRIRSPDGGELDIKLDKKNIILDRAGFDKHIAQLTIDAGVPIRMKHELVGWRAKKAGYKLKFSNGKTVDADYIVGADGPFSPVAKKAGMYGKREILRGWQARVQIKNKSQEFDEHVTDILFGLGEFAWIVPESRKIARIGIIGKDNLANHKEYLKLVKPYKKLSDQSGFIPMYNPKQVLQKGKIALIGDAATQVKATTYGGIIYGFIAGQMIADKWSGYEKRFKAKLGKDLWLSMKMRQALNRISETEASELVKIFEKKENRKILEKSDRNFPSTFIARLLLKETKLWKYGFKAIR